MNKTKKCGVCQKEQVRLSDKVEQRIKHLAWAHKNPTCPACNKGTVRALVLGEDSWCVDCDNADCGYLYDED